jgi:hypothetical protein
MFSYVLQVDRVVPMAFDLGHPVRPVLPCSYAIAAMAALLAVRSPEAGAMRFS